MPKPESETTDFSIRVQSYFKGFNDGRNEGLEVAAQQLEANLGHPKLANEVRKFKENT